MAEEMTSRQRRRAERRKSMEDSDPKSRSKNRFIAAMEKERHEADEEESVLGKADSKGYLDECSSEEEEDDEDTHSTLKRSRPEFLFQSNDTDIQPVVGGFLHDQVLVTPDESGHIKGTIESLKARLRPSSSDRADEVETQTLLEDNGIYHEPKPYDSLTKRNVFRMEQRLYREKTENSCCFDNNGKIRSIPDPIATQPVRPAAALGHTPVPKRLEIKSCNPPKGIQKIGEVGKLKGSAFAEYHTINVFIDTIALHDHNLFSLEDYLSAKIRVLYGEYCRKVDQDGISYHSKRLITLVESEDPALVSDALEELSHLVDEMAEQKRLFKEIYSKWENIQDLRKKQGYIATPIFVAAHKRQLPDTLVDIDVLETLKTRAGLQSEKLDQLLRTHALLLEKKHFLKYVLRVSNDAACTRDEHSSVTPEERARRDAIKDLRVFAVVYVNDKVVSQTTPVSVIWPSFIATVQQRLDLCVISRPRSVSIKVYQKKSFFRGNELLTSVAVPLIIPGHGMHTEIPLCSLAPSDQWYQYASANTIHQDSWHSSFSKVKSYINSDIYRHVAGMVHCRVQWQAQDSGWETLPDNNSQDAFRQHSRGNIQGGSVLNSATVSASSSISKDFSRERDFLTLLEDMPSVDPNDPNNRDLVRLRKLFFSMSATMKQSDIFQAAELYQRLVFSETDRKKYQLSRRQRLLKLREDRPESFSAPIPISEDDIKNDDAYMTLLRPELDYLSDDEDGDQRPQEIQMQKKVSNFMKRVRDNRIAMMRKKRAKKIPLASVVQERALPVQSILDFNNLVNFFQPRRRLRPRPKTRTPQANVFGQCRLFVQIESAANIPIRRQNLIEPSKKARKKKESDDEESESDDEDDAMRLRSKGQISSFVEVRFQEHKKRTSCLAGANPVWMETIVLPFTPPMGDFSANKLKMIKDEVHINLFDQVFIDEREKGGHYEEENANFVRTETRYLGTLSIPFTTIYLNTKIQGAFKCHVPLFQLGYEKPLKKDKTELPDDGVSQDNLSATYITIMATVDPPLPVPVEVDDVPSCGESKKLLSYAEKWMKKVRKCNRLTKTRPLELMAKDINGEAVLITRYLRAQMPPNNLNSVAKLVRFVSLIPFLDDWQAFAGDTDLWSTTQQFLDIKAGDWEEHAVLLRNYFEWQDRKSSEYVSYLVIAEGIPEGQAVYVLRRNTNRDENVLWNASTGEGFNVKDPRCPIQNIGMLAARENVWANVQKVNEPCKLNWEIENNLKSWKPFFNPLFPRATAGKLPSVQLERPFYPETSRELVVQVETDINETLKIQIRRWRSRRFTTSFNTDAGYKLRKILEKLERHKQGEVQLSEKKHQEGLESLLEGKEIYGSPINMTFTDVDRIVVAVQNMKIHLNENPNVQFGLAVYIYAFTNDVLSVWVYLAALTPK